MINKQEKIVEMLNNPYIKKFLESHSLNNQKLLDNYYTFLDCHNSLLKCKNCEGLHTCKQDEIGQVMALEYDGEIYNVIAYCKYYSKELKKQKNIKAFIRRDIPEQYYDVTLDNINIDDDNAGNLSLMFYEILDGIRNKGLYIYGDLGVGKTYMCIALANSLVNKGEKVAFIKANYFINEMRKEVLNNNGEYENIIDKIKKAKYLFIDDIGSETVSEYSRDDLLFNILDYRMENKLCTIFTSNLSKDALLKHYIYDKDGQAPIKAKRLLERIDILSDDYVLKGTNKRREYD